MKKFLLTFILCTGMLAGSPLQAALTPIAKAPAPSHDAGIPVRPLTENEANITYSDYVLFIGGSQLNNYFPVPTETETQIQYKNVAVHNGDHFFLQSMMDYAMFYAKVDDVIVTEANPECELFLYTFADPWENPFYAYAQINAVYDITVNFEGNTARISFEKASDYTFNPALSVLMTPDSSVAPTTVDDHTVIYSNITISGEWKFFIYDRYSHIEFGWASPDNQPVTDANPTAQLVVNPENYVETEGLDGNYDIMLEYNTDFTAATATFSKYRVPESLSSFTGDLYIYGNPSNWAQGAEEYKFTCKEPGIFEWTGESLSSNFRINGGSDQATIPDTDIALVFGGITIPAPEFLKPATPYHLRSGGSYINFSHPNLLAKNVTLTLNLKELTLTLDGELVRPELPLDQFFLIGNTAYAPTVKGENQIAFENVQMDNLSSFYLDNNDFIFGWRVDSEKSALNSGNLTTSLYTDNDASEVEPMKADLKGDYDIYVTFNENRTAATLTCVVAGSGNVDQLEAGKNPLIVYTGEGLEIKGLKDGDNVEIYSLTGLTLHKSVAESETIQVNLPAGNVYILRIADKVFKVIR